ncbi:non-ribosomal peptide synthetase [Paenibacillus mucilaginosus]|uniref:Tyrocidine synthase 3 n=1 Tax=Paenibacillus mucilaginosus (strain KNP414) TaxID=1036673 RepID=F8F8J1_PAEMK|nr:non-ribosomal peptide synthetase [Paenibacillus mucilaginosus]AEI41579.1 Tyrocidine synthase 3 [Paenibacillus mucilaginosus KNP414]MCG7215391.1 non-ribosomal peptide synthetase [Paenibacillus mucilaginosus]WDM30574.1 non-ribosomal peptide synthetase [Paenibacillus mucilaginosus]
MNKETPAGILHEDPTPSMTYWTSLGLDEVERNGLSFDSFDSSAVRQERIVHTLPDELAGKVINITKNNDMLLYVVFLSALSIGLMKYTGREERIIGIPAYAPGGQKNRAVPNKVLPLKTGVSGEWSVKQLLKDMQQKTLDAYEHQYVDVETHLQQANVCRSLTELIPIRATLNTLHSASDIEYIVNSSSSEMTLALNKGEDGSLEAVFVYNAGWLQRETVERFAGAFFEVLGQMLTQPNQAIAAISIAAEHERSQILYEFNRTDTAYADSRLTLPELFTAQAAKSPDRTAVWFQDKPYTFREIEEQSNALARLLQARGVKPESVVGILLERSVELIVGILGVLKSGAAYLPLDPGHPRARKEYILQEAGVKLLLSVSPLAGELDYSGELLDAADSGLFAGDTRPVEPWAGLHDLAYVIYTSGTTGNPKGVMVEHRTLSLTLLWEQQEYGYGDRHLSLPIINHAFDGFITSIFAPLLSGSGVVLVSSEEMTQPDAISEYVKRLPVTHYISVPSIYLTLVEFLDAEDVRHLQMATFVGEELPLKAIEYTRRLNPQIEIVNRYGPSENTVDTTIMRHVGAERRPGGSVPIGRPVANTKVFIVDRHHALVPVGVPGELCIGGERLARGYLNRDDLTARSFIPSPFEPGGTIYKTGDLAKWLPDGTIEFLGRIDNQVKIRGVRIELREIENRLLSHPELKEAVVLVKMSPQKEPYLTAYLVGTPQADPAAVKAYLKEHLPSYMVPAYFIPLDRMPLTTNGKIDRRALPEPDFERAGADFYQAPQTGTEQRLAQLWSEVLGAERVGIHDNFFDLGGHSLKATSLLSKLHKQMKVKLTLKELFGHPTIREMAGLIDTGAESADSPYDRIEPCGPQEWYETSTSQKRMYLIQQLQKGTAYNMPLLCEVEGEFDRQRMEAVFRGLIDRHESLRTSFDNRDGVILQKVHPEGVPFQLVLRQADDEDAASLMQSFVRPFDLSEAPLFRAELAETGGRIYLMTDMHHIVSDGVSAQLLMREFAELYRGGELEPLRIQYKDYAAWQSRFLQSEAMSRQEAYWKGRFEGEIPVLTLPYDGVRPVMQSFEGGRVGFSLDESEADLVRSIARETGSTTQMVLLSAYYILLAKYSGQEDIVIGSAAAGRPHADLQNIVGMFVHTLALRNQAAGAKRYSEFLAEVKRHALEAYENDGYPFESLVEAIQMERDPGRNPLFDVMFNMSHDEEESEEVLGGFRLNQVKRESGLSKFDLTLHASENKRTIECGLEYSRALFEADTVERMALHYKHIIRQIGRNRETQLADINLITEEEKREILEQFNATSTEYPRDLTIHALFEEQVRSTPERTAAVYEGRSVTYRELNARANRLARVLRSEGVGADTVVAIMVERSIEMLIGLLGILKAGGAYLPIDPDYPNERIEYMLNDCKAGILLTSGGTAQRFAFAGVTFDIAAESERAGLAESDPDTGTQVSHLAYVVYSSGSTGQPKGILAEHRNVVRLVKNTNYVEFREDDRILPTGALVFDATTFEIWGALLNGLTLVLVPQDTILSAEKLGRALEEHRITMLWLSVALFNQLAQEKPEMFRPVRFMVVGGEVLSPKHINLVRHACPDLQISNVYGPTENTTFSTSYPIHRDFDTNIPIGRPISNTTAYVVGKRGELLPKGVFGELVLGGDGVARGYLNLPEQTADKFVPSPFVPGERLYRSGDVVRWLADGNIEFQGRADTQVKIRGFRIELEEIRRRLTGHPSVKEAYVTVQETEEQGKVLCAYLTVEAGFERAAVRSYLKESLPDYMVPSYMKVMEQLPLTTNGKVDKRALPGISPEELAEGTYEAPRNATEETLVEIWQDVLGVRRIGIEDHFFDLGGHSLKAMAAIGLIHKELHKAVPLRTFFECPTIKSLSGYLEQAAAGVHEGIPKAEAKPVYPASSAQKRMYTLQQLDQESTAYNIPAVFQLSGTIDQAKIERTLQGLVKRHDAFRTSFETRDGEVVQLVHPDIAFQVEVSEGAGSADDLAGTIRRFIRVFDLAEAPLFRAELACTGDGTYLLLDMHHIISDGVSMGILAEEFAGLYRGEALEPLRIQYTDYSEWQNGGLRSEQMKEQMNYWVSLFQDELPVLNMPYDYERPAVQSFEGSTLRLALGEAGTERLRSLAKQTGSTLNMVLLSALYILLAKYSEQEDIIVGTPVAGRNHPDLAGVVGMFVNTLALRAQPAAAKTYAEFLREVKEHSLKAYEYQSYPLEELLEQINVVRDISRNPLFDVMFALNTEEGPPPGEAESGGDGLVLDPVRFESRISKFDLSVNVLERPGSLDISFEYSSRLFREETIRRLGSHYLQLAADLPHLLEARLADIEMITPQERVKLLEEFTGVGVREGYAPEETFHPHVEAQALRTSEATAVMYMEERLTYRELNGQANRLARKLREAGIGRESVVGILADRSVHLLVAVLAVWKAGGAYVPLDPDYPSDRISYMLRDSGAAVLLTERSLTGGPLADALGESPVLRTVLCLDDAASYAEDASNLPLINEPGDLAYIIYTSGTTGLPKGVMIEHRALVNTAAAYRRDYRLDRIPVRLLQLASFSFDVFVGDIARTLYNGGMMVICPKDDRIDPARMYGWIRDYGLTVFESTPALIVPFLHYLADNGLELSSMELLITSSDSCSVADYRFMQERFGSRFRLINAYGVTEAAIDSGYYDEPLCNLPEAGNVPIGRPWLNARFYILDARLRPVPVGVPGELCIGGAGVARGYLNRPELTEEKFVPNPYVPGEKLYRTGDLARWMPDGNVDFIGRIDNQVKIRGYRIELGEIEARLLGLPGIQEAVVIGRKDGSGQMQLCAYFTAEHSLPAGDIRRQLAQDLPGYMIPSFFVQLEKMPITPNGKLDRKALPAPDGKLHLGAEYIRPRTPLEEQLARIWQEVLGVEKVGVSDHFFELGGHSLKAALLVNRIHKELNVELPLREVFRCPTVEDMAQAIAGMEKIAYAGIPAAASSAYYPVSSAQKRLYILQQLEGAEISYNMTGVLVLDGELDRTRFEEAFRKLIARHEALRTGFELVEGELVQRIEPEVKFAVEFTQADEEEAHDIVRRFVRKFELTQPPLLRVGLIELSKQRHLLMLDLHHIISDGVSMDILTEEFGRLYFGEGLPPLSVQYKDYAVWQQSAEQQALAAGHEAYWLQQFQGELPVLQMPTDYDRPAVRRFEGSTYSFHMDAQLGGKLKRLAADNGATLYMVLFAAYAILLHKYTGQEDLIVGTPVAGRTHPDVQPLVGMFVNTLAIRSYPARTKSFRSYLQEVREATLEAYEHQSYPFEELVERLQVSRDLSRNPLFDVMFVLQNTENRALELEGLQLAAYPNQNTVARFDLTLDVTESSEGLTCRIEYAAALYAKETIERFAVHFRQLLTAIAGGQDTPIAALGILTSAEQKQLYREFNDTAADYESGKTIHELIEEQAERTPDGTAVVFEGRRLTYSELNQRANRLARRLRALGVQPDQPVGLMLERSLEMVVGLLAVLKAGGAYVPIDPEYPEDRIRYMLEDSGTQLLLLQSRLRERIQFTGTVVPVDDESLYGGEDSSNLPPVPGPSHLAYIIYTSGTTGRPKGVMLEHRGLCSLKRVFDGVLRMTQEDRVVQFASLSFDAATWEVCQALFFGAALYIPSKETILDYPAFERFMNANAITTATLPPAYAAYLKPERLPGMTKLITAGSASSMELVRQWQSRGRYFNAYGPTEDSICTTVWEASAGISGLKSVPIGRPIANHRIYIVDADLQPQPVGVVGELCIAGVGLARGYWNRPDLTAEKFVMSPFLPGERMYRSGDLARWLPDGSIEYVGRADHQVKIRGFRIELDEIERRLAGHPAITEAAVIAKENGRRGKYLSAYVTVSGVFDKAGIIAYLKESLPDYMVPAHLKALDGLPLTPNGKVDKRALANLPADELEGRVYEAPGNPTEARLAAIWEEVLGISGIGIQDHFFEAGGSSLSLVKLSSMIKDEFHVSLPLTSLYKYPTIKLLSPFLLHEELRSKLEEDGLALLNEKQDAHLFAFPPIAGLGIVYSELARSLDSHSFYSFDFIESEDRIERYVKLITAVQPEGPYVLFGYSAGGNLAFEVAVELNRRGLEVSDVIMLDSGKFDSTAVQIQDGDQRRLHDELMEEAAGHPYYKALLDNESFRQKLVERIRIYSGYLNSMSNDEIIRAHIHLVESEKVGEAPKSVNSSAVPLDWSHYTTKGFKRYPGFGTHGEMIAGANLLSNAAVLAEILKQTSKIEVF